MKLKELKLLRAHLEEIELNPRWLRIAQELLKPENMDLSVTQLEIKLKTTRYVIKQIYEIFKIYLKQNFK